MLFRSIVITFVIILYNRSLAKIEQAKKRSLFAKDSNTLALGIPVNIPVDKFNVLPIKMKQANFEEISQMLFTLSPTKRSTLPPFRFYIGSKTQSFRSSLTTRKKKMFTIWPTKPSYTPLKTIKTSTSTTGILTTKIGFEELSQLLFALSPTKRATLPPFKFYIGSKTKTSRSLSRTKQLLIPDKLITTPLETMPTTTTEQLTTTTTKLPITTTPETLTTVSTEPLTTRTTEPLITITQNSPLNAHNSTIIKTPLTTMRMINETAPNEFNPPSTISTTSTSTASLATIETPSQFSQDNEDKEIVPSRTIGSTSTSSMVKASTEAIPFIDKSTIKSMTTNEDNKQTINEYELKKWDESLSWRFSLGNPKYPAVLDSLEYKKYCERQEKINISAEVKFYNSLYPNNSIVDKVGKVFAEEANKFFRNYCDPKNYQGRNNVLHSGFMMNMGARSAKMHRDSLVRNLLFLANNPKKFKSNKLACFLTKWNQKTESKYPGDYMKEEFMAYLSKIVQRISKILTEDANLEPDKDCSSDFLELIEESGRKSIQLLVLKVVVSLVENGTFTNGQVTEEENTFTPANITAHHDSHKGNRNGDDEISKLHFGMPLDYDNSSTTTVQTDTTSATKTVSSPTNTTTNILDITTTSSETIGAPTTTTSLTIETNTTSTTKPKGSPNTSTTTTLRTNSNSTTKTALSASITVAITLVSNTISTIKTEASPTETTSHAVERNVTSATKIIASPVLTTTTIVVSNTTSTTTTIVEPMTTTCTTVENSTTTVTKKVASLTKTSTTIVVTNTTSTFKTVGSPTTAPFTTMETDSTSAKRSMVEPKSPKTLSTSLNSPVVTPSSSTKAKEPITLTTNSTTKEPMEPKTFIHNSLSLHTTPESTTTSTPVATTTATTKSTTTTTESIKTTTTTPEPITTTTTTTTTSPEPTTTTTPTTPTPEKPTITTTTTTTTPEPTTTTTTTTTPKPEPTTTTTTTTTTPEPTTTITTTITTPEPTTTTTTTTTPTPEPTTTTTTTTTTPEPTTTTNSTPAPTMIPQTTSGSAPNPPTVLATVTDNEKEKWDDDLSWRMPFGDPRRPAPLELSEYSSYCERQTKITSEEEIKFYHALYPNNAVAQKVGKVFAEDGQEYIKKYCAPDKFRNPNAITNAGTMVNLASRDAKMHRDTLVDNLMQMTKKPKNIKVNRIACFLDLWAGKTEGAYSNDQDIKEEVSSFMRKSIQKISKILVEESNLQPDYCEFDFVPIGSNGTPPKSIQLLVLQVIDSVSKNS